MELQDKINCFQVDSVKYYFRNWGQSYSRPRSSSDCQKPSIMTKKYVTYRHVSAQKMKFFIKDFFSKCYQIRSFLCSV